MTKIIFLPHKILLPKGGVFTVSKNESILDVALRNGVNIEHACEKSCACSTCHCIVRKGYESLSNITEQEEDLLDKAWGVKKNSRLSCQAIVIIKDINAEIEIEIEIPTYTLNY